ncbi:MAG: hypothetical protein M0Z85_00030 [Gammaproteobacteria bacterium]|nr:hypothetical protein [Gammaproteobacteria bacterium]
MSSGIGLQNVRDIMANGTRSAQETNWVVGADSTTTVINAVLANPLGTAVNLSAAVTAALTGNLIEFTSGLNLGVQRQVTALTTAGVITLDAALPSTPAVGDAYVIMPAVSVEVDAPENIAQVGGVAVPTDFAGNPVVPTTQFDQLVQNGTVGSTQTGFVASGDEVAYDTLTVNGTYRVNGAAYLQSLVVNLGGTVIVGATGQITSAAF